MKFLPLKLILFLGFLYPQTSNQVNQAKKLIKERGLSQSQVKDIARSQGYTEQQIATASMTELAEYTDVWTLVDGEGNLINTELANYTEAS